MIDLNQVKKYVYDRRSTISFGLVTQIVIFIFYFFLVKWFSSISSGNVDLRDFVSVTLPLASMGILARIAFRGKDSIMGLSLMTLGPLAISRGSLFIILLSFSCLLAGYMLGKYVRARHQLVMLAIAGALVQIIVGSFLWYLLNTTLGTGNIFIASLYSLITGPGFLFLLLFIGEDIFGLSTDLKLMDLCNESCALMRVLREKAPGTFFHCINTAFIAEEAAMALGLDVLLSRAGGLYHDLGKMWKPEYYSENQYEGSNIHENITQELSKSIIISHIDEGVKIARKHRLGREVEEIIRSHHGDAPLYYYDESMGQGADRYPGPKPATREEAIVLLADSMEATARSLKSITEQDLINVVRFVIKRALRDGQIDMNQFEQKDLHLIEEAFLRGLKVIFHNRVFYPSKTGYMSGGAGVESVYEEFKEREEGKDKRTEKDDKEGPTKIKYH